MCPIRWGFATLIVSVLVGCSTNPPYHAIESSTPSNSECATIYKDFDDHVKPDKCGSLDTVDKVDPGGKQMAKCLGKVVDSPGTGGIDNACWHTPSERHDAAQYDLFFAEFDDEGWEADLREKEPRATTEVENLFGKLNSMAKGNERLDVVIYTHGWHGSSKSDNYYAVLFRAFLKSLANIDASEGRHVVGILVGWRGDSILGTGVDALSVWDRKLAAETVSAGAVQGLFERLHHFYLDYSCHPSEEKPLSGNLERCGQVHMLTIGHSYGALINFRSLLGNMETGLNMGADLNKAAASRVYSFGDLVVLLNPAFEGTRYAPLFYSAMRRKVYLGPDARIGGAQLPVVVTLQSRGDWATGIAFPAFRHVTTIGENPLGLEKSQNDQAMGWVPAFETHMLCLSATEPSPSFPEGKRPDSICRDFAPSDNCDTGSTSDQITCRVKTWAPDGVGAGAFKIFGKSLAPIYAGKGMSLVLSTPETEQQPPAYFPYWVVDVDKAIMKDHDDVWNPLTTEFILELYHATVMQSNAQATKIQSERGIKAVPLH